MAVKRSQGIARALRIIDLVAAEQPVGVSALARLLDEDRSAVQRAVLSLADAGWLRQAPDDRRAWELSAHRFTNAHQPHSGTDLRDRARKGLEELCESTGETAFLAIPDGRRFIVIEVVESRHMLRMAPRIGEIIDPEMSATGRAILAWLDPVERQAALGHAVSAEQAHDYALVRTRGYAASIGEVFAGSTNLAAPIFDAQGRPMGVAALCGPTERLDGAKRDKAGERLAALASQLSRSTPRVTQSAPVLEQA
jgi:IclR family acetate operon transcriptional repressor